MVPQSTKKSRKWVPKVGFVLDGLLDLVFERFGIKNGTPNHYNSLKMDWESVRDQKLKNLDF